jgi:predicted nucleic acid-binding protein
VIVVDTTVWIDFLGARGTTFDRHLTELLERDALIALVDIVYCEVLQGIRDEDTFQRARASLPAHPILRPRGLETFETAANLYRMARRRGLTIRHTLSRRRVSRPVGRSTTTTATLMPLPESRTWRSIGRREG